MRLLLCPDSFKESLPATELCALLEQGLHKVDPSFVIEQVPVADGGEGLLEALQAGDSTMYHVDVSGPLEKTVQASYLVVNRDGQKTVVIESAKANGLDLVPKKDRNPMITTSFGIGELLIDALRHAPDHIVVGLGGSSTNDGGVGMLQALGFRLLSSSGEQVKPGNQGLAEITTIEIPLNHPMYSAPITVASDVTNPLTGPEGATLVYGKQKGPADLAQMEKNMLRYKQVAESALGRSIDTAGSGAAGGLGAAFYGFLRAKIQSGFSVVANLTGLEEKVVEADVIITGEGKLDVQTLHGKAPAGVLELARKHKKPIVAVCGVFDDNLTLAQAFDAIVPLSREPLSEEESMARAKELAEQTGVHLATTVLPNLFYHPRTSR